MSHSRDEDEPIDRTSVDNDCSGSKSSGKDTAAVAEPSHGSVERCASPHTIEDEQPRRRSFVENATGLGGCDEPPQDEGHDIGLTSASQTLQSAQVDRSDVSTSVVLSDEDELRQSPVKSVSKLSQGLKDNDKSCGNTQMVFDAFEEDQQRATCSASLETNSCAPGILSPEKTSFVSAELSATGPKPENQLPNARSSTSIDFHRLELEAEQMDVEKKRETSTQATLPDLSDHASISDKNVSPTISENFLYRKRKFGDAPHKEEPETKVFCSGSDPCSNAAVPERTIRVNEREKIYDCVTSLLLKNKHCCATARLVNETHEKLCGERFARPKLLFEAYLVELLATSGSQFTFGNQYGGPGASWVFCKPEERGVKFNKAISLPHAELLPEIVNLCKSHLLSLPTQEAKMDVLTESALENFSSRLSKHAIKCKELKFLFRCLILVGCLQDKMKRFYFNENTLLLLPKDVTVFSQSVDLVSTHGSIHVPPDPARNASKMSASEPPCLETSARARSQDKSKAQRKVAAALDLVAGFIRTRGPLTKTLLRDIWSTEASKDLVKVLGTGVSFTLAFRKFEKCFPTSADGSLTVNESMLNQLKQTLL